MLDRNKSLAMTWLWVCGLCAAMLPALADAHVMNTRPKMAVQYSGKGGASAEKYFHESSFHHHYDGRFASTMLPQEEASAYLTAIIRTYLATMNDLGVETWIMHGTLLGWWWNQKAGLVRPDDCTGLMILQILPWDTDLDLQVSEAAIHFLAENCNMTEHHFDLPGVPGGRTYLLEVNPHYVVRTTLDTLNTIDARWIDTSSGLFIDITTVRADDDRRLKGNPGALICKDKHRYEEDDLFPLRDSLFEGVAVKIPYEYTKLLRNEYGGQSMTRTKFWGHTFDEKSHRWIKDEATRQQSAKRPQDFYRGPGV